MQQPDPYPDIKQLIERELQHVTKLQTELFAGHGEAAEQLRYAFQDLREQVSALEYAVKSMGDNPSKFQLDTKTAYARQVEVETLRWQLEDLQATCAQVETSTSKDAPNSRNVTFSEVEMHKRK